MAKASASKHLDIGVSANRNLFDSDDVLVTALGDLATKDIIERTDITSDAVTLKDSSVMQDAASSISTYLDLSSISLALDENDSIFLAVTANAPGTVNAEYRILRMQQLDWEIVDTFTLPVGAKSSFTCLIELGDSSQPYIVNELDTATNCNLLGGGAGDTFTGIAQIFLSRATTNLKLNAVEFNVQYHGTEGAGTTTAYLYDSDGSTVGTNLLATSTSYADTANPHVTTGGQGWMRWTFPTPYTLTGATYYAVVVTRSARDASNYFEFYEGPALADSLALKRSSDTWGAVTGIADFAFKLFCQQTTSNWTFKIQGASDAGTVKTKMDAIVFRR